MPSTVRYHAHCIDGIVCAALVKRAMPSIARYAPYLHVAPGEEPDVIEDVVGVDIPFIPGMVMWYDHHASGFQFLSNGRVGPVRCTMRYNPSAKACVELLPRPSAFDVLIREVTLNDSGTFPTPEAASDLSNPVLLATRTINRLADDAVDLAVIERLAATDGDPIAALLDAIPTAELARTVEVTRDHEALLRREARWHRRLLTFDLTAYGNDADGISPFRPYLHFRDAERYVMLLRTTQRTFVRLSGNPWTWSAPYPCRLDLVANRYGGGGHPRAAGITFPAHDAGHDAARRTFEAIIGELSTE